MMNILIISNSYLHKDPRIITQYNALKSKFKVYLCGKSNISEEYKNFILFQYVKPSLIERIKWRYSLLFKDLALYNWDQNIKNIYYQILKLKIKFDLIIINDYDFLPLACKLKSQYKSKIYFDLHEYYLGERSDEEWLKFYPKYIKFIFNKYSKDVDFFTTVNESIKALYQDNLGIKINSIVFNTPRLFEDLKPVEVDMSNVKLVYHGVANVDRRIEDLIKFVLNLPKNFTFHLYLTGHYNYINYLKNTFEGDKIFFHEPVRTELIPYEINKYDIGFCFLPPSNVNYLFSLPNKFFENIQARLMLLISPNPEMKKICEEENIGIVCDSFNLEEAYKKVINLKKEDIMKFKINAGKAAFKYNSQKSETIIFKNVKKLIGQV